MYLSAPTVERVAEPHLAPLAGAAAKLEAFFDYHAPLLPGDRVLVAFSGGPDSTALLAAIAELSSDRQFAVVAAHLDHGLDGGSATRARAARRIAGELCMPIVCERLPVNGQRRRGESVEAAARRVRYEFLENQRRRHECRWVATGHHRDDQAETVFLRLLFGSGWEGLGGIAPRRGSVVRPLLSCTRRELASWLEPLGVEPVFDRTNLDRERPRNRIRELGLEILADGQDPEDLCARLARLASVARSASRRLEDRLLTALSTVNDRADGSFSVSRDAMAALPAVLRRPALAALFRRSGSPYPPTTAALSELERQLVLGRDLGCDAGGGWRITAQGDRLAVAKEQRQVDNQARIGPFAYTLRVPGELQVAELSRTFRVRQRRVRPWMFSTALHRAGFSLDLRQGDEVTIRNRRPGDRIQPLGASGSRRLKDVLIDRKIPRAERDRLPLLCRGDRIVWVPGVAVAEEARIGAEATVWSAEIEA